MPAESDNALPVDAVLDLATADHRAGRLEAAERGYEDVLRRTPQDARALHNLALLLLQRGDAERGLSLLAAACAARPQSRETWVTYIRALSGRSRHEAALQVLTDHLEADPARDALEAMARRTWAQALLGDGAAEAAEGQLRRVRDLTPDDADAHADLGVVQSRLNRLEDARSTLEHASRLAPESPAVALHLAGVLQRLGDLGGAETHCRRALAAAPGDAAAVRALGGLMNQLGRHDEALDIADRALGQARTAEAMMLRGHALRALSRDAEALESYLAAADLDGARFEALLRAAELHVALRQYEAALAVYDAAIALRPDDPEAHLFRAYVHMLLQDFQRGWLDYEKRWRRAAFMDQSGSVMTPELVNRLEADLERRDLAGRRVLLLGEQGVGDQLMFASLIPDLSGVAAQVTCVCEPRLVGLLSASLADVRFLDPSTAHVTFAEIDKVVAMGTLGRLFRSRLEDFPRRAYLRPRAEVRDRWAARLGPRPRGLRIGLSWRGGSALTNASRRSMTLARLSPVLCLPDCEFVSLQYGEVADEVAAASVELGRPIRVFPKDEIDDFEELAGLVEALDVVVSVQTSVVHLAGATGKDCLAMLPYSPEWRYTASSPTMPWYGSVALHRQRQPDVWDPVIDDVVKALKVRLRRALERG